MQLIRFQPRRVANVVSGLTLFWCAILSAFFWIKGGVNFQFMVLLSATVVAGFFLASIETDAYADNIRKRLGFKPERGLPVDHKDAFASETRGISVSIGPVPFQYPLPARLNALELKQGELAEIVQQHLPKEFAESPDFLESFITAIDSGPQRKLIRAMLEVYCHPSHVTLPAGITRHNGSPLLTHCLRVAALMHHRVRDFQCKNYYVSFNDPSYRLPADDPLLIVVGLSHDLGKVNSLIRDKEGKYVAIATNHHKEGSRILSTLPEFWTTDLSPEDRYILQSCCVYATDYVGSPVSVSTGKDKKVVAVSDRFQCLLDLVIDCDIAASQIENGTQYRFDMPAADNATMQGAVDESKSESFEDTTINLYARFSGFLAVEAVVNGQGADRNLGFKYVDTSTQAPKHLLFVDEEEFTKMFSAFLQRPDWNSSGTKGSALTMALLPKLDDAGYLVRADNVGADPAINALYKVEFYGGTPPVIKLVFKSCFIVDVTNWPHQRRLQQLPTCSVVPKIINSIFGNRFSPQRRAAGDANVLKELGAGSVEDAESVIEALVKANQAAKQKKKQAVASTSTAITVVQKIEAALVKKLITPAIQSEPGQPIPIAQGDAFFRGLGIVVEPAETATEAMRNAGILEIRKSKKIAGTHIVILDGKTYVTHQSA